MKSIKISCRNLVPALMLLLFASTTIAAPRVVVTIPPLHSLVSGLMTGVAEPALLMESTEINQGGLTPAQKLQLISADMVIWVGAGLEKQIATTVQNEFPAVDRNMYAISNHLPLLPKSADVAGQLLMPEARQDYSDLGFWADPKLAAMAVRHITPKLVQLDPDNADAYLENELKLLARLKEMGRQLAETLAPYRGSLGINDSVPTYLAWRYHLHGSQQITLASADTTAHHIAGCQNFVKVGQVQPDPDTSDIYGSNLKPGEELYFQMMQRQARFITGCSQQAKRVAGRTAGPITQPRVAQR